MRSYLYRWLLPSLAAVSLVSAVHGDADAKRRPPPDYRSDEPREAPPPPRQETHEATRAGFFWQEGHFEWRRGKGWDWVPGHWERERPGQRYRPVRWEKRGPRWVKLDGDFVNDDKPAWPTSAPPALRAEAVFSKPGMIWIKGHWVWRNGWDWVPGRHEPERRGERWVDQKWENRGGRWEVTEGRWERDPSAPVLAWPRSGPPALKPEAVVSIKGKIWIKGHWAWRNGNWDWIAGRHENERPGSRWRDARWENRGDRWEIIDGGWEVDTKLPYPTSEPPAPKTETPPARQGMVFIRGRWDWRDGQWVWLEGRWETARAYEHFVDGRWERKGDRFTWVEGKWTACNRNPPLDNPPPAPRANITPNPGFQVIPGHWHWVGCKYEWDPGGQEKPRAGQKYVAGNWARGADGWMWTAGAWVADKAPPPDPYKPPPPAPKAPPPAPDPYKPR